MVKCWVVLVLVVSTIFNVSAWKSSTEERRHPNELRRDLTLNRRDAINRRGTPNDRRGILHGQREMTQDLNDTFDLQDVNRRNAINRRGTPNDRRGILHGQREMTQDLKDTFDHQTVIQNRRDIIKNRREPRELRRVHYHNKRHMLPDSEPKKRSTTLKPIRDVRKKPSGHLTPLEDDDMEIDEVVSVAIGPPPLRGKFEKSRKKHIAKPSTPSTPSAVGLVKDLITQITKEFLSRDVDENFVFGQYLGNAMKNLTSELRLSMQHEILELIVKYQKLNRGDVKVEAETKSPPMLQILKDVKIEKKFTSSNDTEEPWPDFSNLAKIVG